MKFNDKVKTIFNEYKALYKSYWRMLHDKECKIEDDNTFMITALTRAICSIEKELEYEQVKINRAVEALVTDMKEDGEDEIL